MMQPTNSRQIVHLHMPKTGGTTLRRILYDRFGNRVFHYADWGALLMRQRTIEFPGLTGLTEADRAASPFDGRLCKIITGHLYYEIANLMPEPPLFMTMLRHPIEQKLSDFRYIQRSEDHRDHAIVSRMTFEEFLRDFGGNTYADYLTTRVDPDQPERPQERPFEEQPDLAAARLKQFAFVGLMEQFDASIQLLAATFGWEPFGEYQLQQVAPTPTSREDVSSEALAYLNEVCAADIGLYELGREIFESRRSDEGA